MVEKYLESQDTLWNRVKDKSLQKLQGVYLIRCAECGHSLYAGQAADFSARLTAHAFCPPWGAVDILYGDPVRPEMRDRFCDHLKAAKQLPRSEVVKILLAELETIPEKEKRDLREQAMFQKFPDAYGRRIRLWQNPAEFLDYYSEKGAGYTVGLKS